MNKRVIIGIIIGILVLAVGGTALFVGLRSQKQAEQKLIQQAEEAKPYEDQIAALQEQLDAEEQAIVYQSEQGILTVSFVMSGPEDVDLIQTEADQYGFTPTIVFDLSREVEDTEAIIAALSDCEWQYIFTATPLDENTFDSLDHYRDLLAGTKMTDTGCFLLRNSDDAQENIDTLIARNFTSCTRYTSNYGAAGDIVQDLYVFEYCYISSNLVGNTSLTRRYDGSADSHYPILVTYDLTAIAAGNLTAETVDAMISEAEDYTIGTGNMRYGLVSEITAEIQVGQDTQAERQAAYDADKVTTEEEIRKLEEKIHAIYGDWNE